VIEPGKPVSSWQLDDSAAFELQRLPIFLERSVRLASWYNSSELKAIATARAMTDDDLKVDPALREATRADWFARHEQFQAAC
jgi:hypothetical protein